jgi:hypothetical protein
MPDASDWAVVLIALACCSPFARGYAQSGDVMRRFLLTVATAASALAAASCSDATGIRADLEGTYTLWTVNGVSPPEFVPEFDAEIVSGEVTLYRDGTYEDELRVRFTGESFIDRFTSTGTYSVSGNEIRFNPDDPNLSTYTMEWDRDRLTQIDLGVTLVYRR